MHAAGTDPAYVPGLLPPRPAEGADQETPDEAVATPPENTAPEGAAPAVPANLTLDDLIVDEDEAEEAAAPEDEGEDDLPVFDVSDRRSSITADRFGITFKLDGEIAEFGWDEIGAVETDSPRFGRRFSVTVYTTGRRRYQADVEASSRGTLKQWAADLDAVLDARFEDAPEEVEEEAEAAAPEEVEETVAAEETEAAEETVAAEEVEEAEAETEAKTEAKAAATADAKD